MPIDDTAIASRRIARLAIGTALSLWFSQAIGWTLSFIAPVITMMVLAMPWRGLPLKFCAKIGLAVFVPIYGSLLLLPILLNYPAAGLLIVGLVLFHAFYFSARGGAAVVATLITIAVTVTVAVGTVSIDGVLAVVKSISFGAVVGIAFAALAHAVFPDRVQAGPKKMEKTPVEISLFRARHSAIRSIAVVLPVVIWFLLSAASAGNAGVMIKVATMGQQVSMADTRKAARSLILSTALGGFAAVIAWQVLSIWPSLEMYALLVGIAGLFFGARIFKGAGLNEDADTWSYAFLTMIVILAPAALDSQFGSAAGAKFLDRLWMFAGATLYGVAAVLLIDTFWPARERNELCS